MEQPSWRAFLGNIIADARERQYLANTLGVNPATLTRWVSSETNPRPQNLRELLRALPKQQNELLPLIAIEFPEFATSSIDTEPDNVLIQIPAEFYTRVIAEYTKARRLQRFWTVSSLVLTQALSQLDPNTVGLAVTIAQCVPPSRGQKVRSLRETIGRGTPPWQSSLTQESLFLGVESLAGYAVTKGRSFSAENRLDRLGFYPVRWEAWEESAAVCPIWFENRIAGCLVASSTQPRYFLPFRQALIEQYAQLLVLAFEPEDFYDLQDIELMPMPPHEEQQQRVIDFRQHLSEILLTAGHQHQNINIEQAERLVWQQLEGELLDLLNREMHE